MLTNHSEQEIELLNNVNEHLMTYIYECEADCKRDLKKQILNHLFILRQLDHNLNNLSNLALRSICQHIPNSVIDDDICEEDVDQNVFEHQMELECEYSNDSDEYEESSDEMLLWLKCNHSKGIINLTLPEVAKNIKYECLTSMHEIFMHDDSLQFMNEPRHIKEYMQMVSNSSITKIDFSELDISSVTDMSNIFSGFTHLKYIDLHNINTSQA